MNQPDVIMTLYQRKTGVWYVRFHNQHKTPSEKRISLKTKDKEVAKEKAKELELKKVRGEWCPWEGNLVYEETLIDACYIVLEGHYSKLKETTYTSRENFYNLFADEVGRDKPVKKIGAMHIRDFLSSYEGSTLKTWYSYLSKLFKELKMRDVIDKNPMDKVTTPRVRSSNHRITFEDEEYLAFIENMNNEWMKTLMVISYHTGMRQGEIRHLLWRDVDLKKRLIHVRITEYYTPKGNKERVCPIPVPLYEYLLDWRERQNNHCWETKPYSDKFVIVDYYGKPPNTGAAIKSFREWRERLGIRDELTLHKLRHTFASRMMREGMPIHVLQDILGHSSIDLTRVYAHHNSDSLSSWVNKIYDKE